MCARDKLTLCVNEISSRLPGWELSAGGGGRADIAYSHEWFIPGRASNPGKNGRDFAPYEGFVPYGDYGSAVKERRLAVTLKRGLLRKNRSQ